MIIFNNKILEPHYFSNGERRLEGVKELISDKNRIFWKFENDSELFSIRLLEDLIKRNKEKCVVDLTFTSMPYERMDRSENGQHFSLEVFISMLPKNWNYIIACPHSDVCLDLLKRHIYSSNKVIATSIMNFLFNESIIKDEEMDDKYILYPDKGSLKRYSFLIDNNKVKGYYYAEKQRDFDTGKILGLKIFNGETKEEVKDFNGNKLFVVDDLSSYGGTFYFLGKKAKELNAGEMYLILEKCEDSILKGKLFDDKIYEYIKTTNLLSNTLSSYSINGTELICYPINLFSEEENEKTIQENYSILRKINNKINRDDIDLVIFDDPILYNKFEGTKNFNFDKINTSAIISIDGILYNNILEKEELPIDFIKDDKNVLLVFTNKYDYDDTVFSYKIKNSKFLLNSKDGM